jgi:hypothetical protein
MWKEATFAKAYGIKVRCHWELFALKSGDERAKLQWLTYIAYFILHSCLFFTNRTAGYTKNELWINFRRVGNSRLYGYVSPKSLNWMSRIHRTDVLRRKGRRETREKHGPTKNFCCLTRSLVIQSEIWELHTCYLFVWSIDLSSPGLLLVACWNRFWADLLPRVHPSSY